MLSKCLPILKLLAMMFLRPTFYQGSWNLLGHQLNDALNYSYQYGELSNSQNKALIIRVIEKKDRDSGYIKNCRPILLSSVDVKITCKAPAIRLANVLPEIIRVA